MAEKFDSQDPVDPGASGESGGHTGAGGTGSNSREENPKRELAEERTDWAKERTLLAKQRTFAAWLRTGLAAAGGGFAAAEFLGELQPRWIVITASVLLVLSGAVIFVIGYTGYRDTFRKLRDEGVQGLHPSVIAGVTFAMLLGALLLLYSVVA